MSWLVRSAFGFGLGFHNLSWLVREGFGLGWGSSGRSVKLSCMQKWPALALEQRKKK